MSSVYLDDTQLIDALEKAKITAFQKDDLPMFVLLGIAINRFHDFGINIEAVPEEKSMHEEEG